MTQGGRTETSAREPERRPPLGSWARLYALVLAGLLVDLWFLWALTERYR